MAIEKTTPTHRNASQISLNSHSSLHIPSKLGQITESFEGKSNQTVIQIQDVHCHFEAQSNVARILDEILKKHEGHGLEVINVEGSSGLLDTSLLSLFPDSKIKKSLALYYLKKGKINGAEFLSITKDRPLKLNGAENLNLYFENLKWFDRSLKLRRDAQETLEKTTEILDQLKEKVYNLELKKYLTQKNDYEESKTDIETYLNGVQKLSEEKNVKINDLVNVGFFLKSSRMGREIQFDKIEEERAKVIEKLLPKLDKSSQAEFLTKGLYLRLEKITPEEYYQYFESLLKLANIEISSTEKNFNQYIQYLKVFGQIQKGKLFDEMDEWENRLKEKLMQNEEEHNLEKASKYVSFLKNFYHLELTRKDLQFYQDSKKDFGIHQLKEILEKQTVKYNIQLGEASHVEKLEKDLADLEAFYKAAIARDAVLVEKTLESFQSPVTTRTTQDAPRTTVLLAGGFHTEGVAQKLKEKGVSYVVITPRVTEIRAKTPYISVMTDERSELENILVKEIFKKQSSVVSRQSSVKINETEGKSSSPTTNLKFATSNGQYKLTTIKKRKTVISDTDSTQQNSNTALATMSSSQNIDALTAVAEVVRASDLDVAAAVDRKAEALKLAIAEQALVARISVLLADQSFYFSANGMRLWENAVRDFAIRQKNVREILSTANSIRVTAQRLGEKIYLTLSDSNGQEVAGFIVGENFSREGLLVLEGNSLSLRDFRKERNSARQLAEKTKSSSSKPTPLGDAPYRTLAGSRIEAPSSPQSRPVSRGIGGAYGKRLWVSDVGAMLMVVAAACGPAVGMTTSPSDADQDGMIVPKDVKTTDASDVDASLTETGVDAVESEPTMDVGVVDGPVATDGFSGDTSSMDAFTDTRDAGVDRIDVSSLDGRMDARIDAVGADSRSDVGSDSRTDIPMDVRINPALTLIAVTGPSVRVLPHTVEPVPDNIFETGTNSSFFGLIRLDGSIVETPSCYLGQMAVGGAIAETLRISRDLASGTVGTVTSVGQISDSSDSRVLVTVYPAPDRSLYHRSDPGGEVRLIFRYESGSNVGFDLALEDRSRVVYVVRDVRPTSSREGSMYRLRFTGLPSSARLTRVQYQMRGTAVSASTLLRPVSLSWYGFMTDLGIPGVLARLYTPSDRQPATLVSSSARVAVLSPVPAGMPLGNVTLRSKPVLVSSNASGQQSVTERRSAKSAKTVLDVFRAKGLGNLLRLLVACMFFAVMGCSSQSPGGPILDQDADQDVIEIPDGDASVPRTDAADAAIDGQTPVDVSPRDVSVDVVPSSSTVAMANMGGDAPTIFLGVSLLDPVTSGTGTFIGQYEIDTQLMTMEVHLGANDYPANDSEWLEMYKRWRRRILIGGHLGPDGSIEVEMRVDNPRARQAIAAHIAAGRNFIFGLDALWNSAGGTVEAINGAMLVFTDAAGRVVKTINATESDGRRQDFGKIVFPASEFNGIDFNSMSSVKFVLRRDHVGSNGDFSIALDPGFYGVPYYATSNREGRILPFTITTLDRDIPGRPDYYPVGTPTFRGGVLNTTVRTDDAAFRREGRLTVVARGQSLDTLPFTPTVDFPALSGTFDLVTSANPNGLVHIAVMAPQAREGVRLAFQNLASTVFSYVYVTPEYGGGAGGMPTVGTNTATYRYFAFPADTLVRRGSSPTETGVNPAAVTGMRVGLNLLSTMDRNIVIGFDGPFRVGPTALGRGKTRQQRAARKVAQGHERVEVEPTVVGKGKIENGSYAEESGIGNKHANRMQRALARAIKENSTLANVNMLVEFYSDLDTDAEVHSNHVRFRAGAFDDDGLATPWQEGTVDFMLAFKIRHELTPHDTKWGEILPMMGDLRFFYNATLKEKREFIERAGKDPYARFILENYNKSFDEQLTAVIGFILVDESLPKEERIYPPDQIAKAKQFKKLRTQHAQVTELQEKLSAYQVHATAAGEVQMVTGFLELGKLTEFSTGSNSNTGFSSREAEGRVEKSLGQRIVGALSRIIPVFAEPIGGDQLKKLLKAALRQLANDVVSDDEALLKAIDEAIDLIATRGVTLDQLNEKVTAIVAARLAQEDQRNSDVGRVRKAAHFMHNGILASLLQMADFLRGGRVSPVSVYRLVEEYRKSSGALDGQKGQATLENLMATLPEISRTDGAQVTYYADKRSRDFLGYLIRDLNEYFVFLAKVSEDTRNGLGKLEANLGYYSAASDSKLKNLLLQTQARVIEITEEGAIKIGSEIIAIEGASEKLASLREKSGVRYIDLVSQGVVSPQRFARILDELLAWPSPAHGDEKIITGFSDEHAVEMRKEGDSIRVRVIPEINFVERYQTRVGALQAQYRERTEPQFQVWGGETLKLRVARDASGQPIREGGKVKVVADAQSFAEFYRAFGSLKNRSDIFAINVIISFILEEGISPSEVDEDAVLKSILDDLGYAQAKTNRNVKVLLHSYGSQNLAREALVAIVNSFYLGMEEIFNSSKQVFFILSEAEAKNYGDLKDLVYTILTGSLDAKSAYLLAEQLASGGVLEEGSELYNLLRKADPETLAALNDHKTSSLKESFESLELGMRSHKAVESMA